MSRRVSPASQNLEPLFQRMFGGTWKVLICHLTQVFIEVVRFVGGGAITFHKIPSTLHEIYLKRLFQTRKMSDEHGNGRSNFQEMFKKLGSDYANNPLSSSAGPYLKQAWSDDESTVASLSKEKFMKRRRHSQTSYDESTILSTQSNTRGSFSFYDWLDYTKDLTEMVSKQINDCTSGPEHETKEPGFTLKDEDFFWSPTANSFDTADTRKTNYLPNSTFSRWDQRVELWDSERTNLVENKDIADSKEELLRDHVS